MQKIKKILFLIGLLLFALLVVAGCGGTKEENKETGAKEEKFKVGFMFVGAPSDGGWNYSFDQGRTYLEEKMSNVKTVVLTNVKPGVDDEKALNDLIKEGCKIIFSNDLGYQENINKVAKQNPNVTFMHGTGFKREAPNVGTFFGQMHQIRYLTGMIAGKMTKTNKVGFEATMKVPEVYRHIDSFTLGVRAVNPQATVNVVWTNTWYDPAKEKEAALSLIDAGADVIACASNTTAPLMAAKEKKVYAIAWNADAYSKFPDTVLTSCVWNWGPLYEKVVKLVMDGQWKSEHYMGTINDDVTQLGTIGPMVGQDIKDLVEQKKKEMLDGKFKLWAGPIKDNAGKVRVPAGQEMDPNVLLGLDWYVEGINASVK